MTEHQASRTLVKSHPELWAECSDPSSLARHLDQFGEIRVTRLDPESAVAWEGERASGTVQLEPSGWGTRVTLTVRPVRPVAEPQSPEPSEPQPPPLPRPLPPAAGPEPAAARRPTPRRGRLAWLRTLFLGDPVAEPEPIESLSAPTLVAEEPAAPAAVERRPAPAPAAAEEPAAPAALEPAPAPAPAEESSEALTAALDSLGRAHHRPYSRS